MDHTFKFKHDEEVSLNFGKSGILHNARITKAAITKSQEWYDVEVSITEINEFNELSFQSVRLHNINGAFLISCENKFDLPKG